MTTTYTAHLEWVPDQTTTLDDVDELLEGDSRGTAASVSPDGHRVSATFTAAGTDPTAALADAIHHATGIIPGRVVVAEIITTDEADRRLAEPPFPELAGIAEVAELLDVSRQRASQLQTNHDFPAPVAVLRSGPVWRSGDLSRFRDSWARKPGRPAATKPAGR